MIVDQGIDIAANAIGYEEVNQTYDTFMTTIGGAGSTMSSKQTITLYQTLGAMTYCAAKAIYGW